MSSLDSYKIEQTATIKNNIFQFKNAKNGSPYGSSLISNSTTLSAVATVLPQYNYLVNTTTAGFAITLPLGTPEIDGALILLVDSGNAAVNNWTVYDPNTLATILTASTNDTSYTFLYNKILNKWQIIASY